MSVNACKISKYIITEITTEAKENCLWLNHKTGSQSSASFSSHYQMSYNCPYPDMSAYGIFQKDNRDFCMYAYTHTYTHIHIYVQITAWFGSSWRLCTLQQWCLRSPSCLSSSPGSSSTTIPTTKLSNWSFDLMIWSYFMIMPFIYWKKGCFMCALLAELKPSVTSKSLNRFITISTEHLSS